jgi:hypothetical protein
MASTYTSNQGIEKMDTGDQSGTWGGTVNTNMDIIDRAISGVGALTLTGSTTTLTTTDGTLTDGMYRVLVLGDGGDLGSDNTITISPNDQDKAYLVYNNLSANRNAIFTQGTGANATVENGETAWIYADGGGSGAIVRTAVSSTKLLDQDADTGIRVEEGGDDDDTIRFDIAGAEDFTMTANTFNVLSGSTLDVNSGATITNNGTATGFGVSEAAVSGVLVADAEIIDLVIFGPALDPVDWSGRTPAATASLMAASLHDAGSDSTVKIWDLTSTTLTSQTPLATLTISGAAEPFCIGAWMGWVAVGTEDGFSIFSPHNAINGSGATGGWLEHTTGHPHSRTVAQAGDSVKGSICVGASDQPLLDSRTGGPMPCIGFTYAEGSWKAGIVNDRGQRFNDTTASTTSDTSSVIINGRFYYADDTGSSAKVIATPPISQITANNWTEYKTFNANSTYGYYLGSDNSFDATPQLQVAGDAGGLSFGAFPASPDDNNDHGTDVASCWITRDYNTGYNYGDCRGTWLCNSDTADRNVQNHTLTKTGTVNSAAVNGSSELLAYSNWATGNHLDVASNEDWDEVGTGDVYMSIWFKSANVTASAETYFGFANSGDTIRCAIQVWADGEVNWYLRGATAALNFSTSAYPWDDGAWHKADMVQVSSTERYIYVDGVLQASNTTDIGSLTSDGNLPLAIGDHASSTSEPATTSSLALAKFSLLDGTPGTVPDAAMIQFMYDQERPMFYNTDSEVLLQSGSTDAVLDTYIDRSNGKVVVTQTDSQIIWDGLVVESKPTVNSGSSEHNQMFGDDRVEVNSANIYATVGAKDIRSDLDLVRGLATQAAENSMGIDLSKAKAWVSFRGSSTVLIRSGFNIKSITDNGTGDYTIFFGTPFRSVGAESATRLCCIGMTENEDIYLYSQDKDGTYIRVRCEDNGSLADTNIVMVAVFGELANE